MQLRLVSAGAVLLFATALPAVAQDAAIGLSLQSSTSGDAAATAPLDVQITGDNSYAALTAAINSSEAVDLSAVTEYKVKLVLVSTLEGDAATEGAALDAAIAARADALATLRSNVMTNAVINAKLTAQGYAADDVLAIRTDASGNTLVYVDDRK